MSLARTTPSSKKRVGDSESDSHPGVEKNEFDDVQRTFLGSRLSDISSDEDEGEAPATVIAAAPPVLGSDEGGEGPPAPVIAPSSSGLAEPVPWELAVSLAFSGNSLHYITRSDEEEAPAGDPEPWQLVASPQFSGTSDEHDTAHCAVHSRLGFRFFLEELLTPGNEEQRARATSLLQYISQHFLAEACIRIVRDTFCGIGRGNPNSWWREFHILPTLLQAHRWETMSATDRRRVKTVFVECLAQNDSTAFLGPVTDFLAELAHRDTGEKWPEIIEFALQRVNDAADFVGQECGLLLIAKLTPGDVIEDEVLRDTVDNIFNLLLPYLYNPGQSLKIKAIWVQAAIGFILNWTSSVDQRGIFGLLALTLNLLSRLLDDDGSDSATLATFVVDQIKLLEVLGAEKPSPLGVLIDRIASFSKRFRIREKTGVLALQFMVALGCSIRGRGSNIGLDEGRVGGICTRLQSGSCEEVYRVDAGAAKSLKARSEESHLEDRVYQKIGRTMRIFIRTHRLSADLPSREEASSAIQRKVALYIFITVLRECPDYAHHWSGDVLPHLIHACRTADQFSGAEREVLAHAVAACAELGSPIPHDRVADCFTQLMSMIDKEANGRAYSAAVSAIGRIMLSQRAGINNIAEVLRNWLSLLPMHDEVLGGLVHGQLCTLVDSDPLLFDRANANGMVVGIFSRILWSHTNLVSVETKAKMVELLQRMKGRLPREEWQDILTTLETALAMVLELHFASGV
ncbi:hypothetical protein Tsubulata_021939 [Turnera subulata]|uniref:Uncharacterized protein n=1 Tax=Turnera subulata TaxID=218843 RepID=A0A9Q0F0B8_9ROSI|nr:hypothetical protein Tsubulata_021939 [Turnera subulata]